MEIPGGLGTTEVTIDYTYDSLYRLTAADYDDEDGTFFHYTYDAVGNRLTQDTLAGTNTYAYDIANRLTNVDGVSYTWDNNGNLLTDGTSTYTYNYANMLASVNQGGVVYDYHYSGLGDRLQQLIDGVPTNYTLDINTGLTQVLADGTHTYLYGRGRIAQDGSVTEYFLGDALSSVRQLVDSTDAVSLTQSYEPFGTVLSSEGEGESIYNFTGEIKDSYIKLLYLRSRYMSVDTGRFVTKDVWNGDYTTPMSYNAWLYAYANPVKYTDPSGYCVFFGMDTAFCLALLIGIPTIAGVTGAAYNATVEQGVGFFGRSVDCVDWNKVFNAGSYSLKGGANSLLSYLKAPAYIGAGLAGMTPQEFDTWIWTSIGLGEQYQSNLNNPYYIAGDVGGSMGLLYLSSMQLYQGIKNAKIGVDISNTIGNVSNLGSGQAVATANEAISIAVEGAKWNQIWGGLTGVAGAGGNFYSIMGGGGGSDRGLKQVKAVADEFGMNESERHAFSDYIHDAKQHGNYGTLNEKGDFTMNELRDLAREFLNIID